MSILVVIRLKSLSYNFDAEFNAPGYLKENPICHGLTKDSKVGDKISVLIEDSVHPYVVSTTSDCSDLLFTLVSV